MIPVPLALRSRSPIHFLIDLISPSMRTLTLAVLSLSALSAMAAQDSLHIPKGGSANIDGRIEVDEWRGAYETTLSDGSRLFLRHDGEYLYLAVKAATKGYPSVCVTTGDTTRILHSSAALASATYVRASSEWHLQQPFAFAIRSSDTSDGGKAVHRAYLAKEHWLASNSAMSESEREMQIALSLTDRGNVRLALGFYVTAATERVASWPATLNDGCTALKTVQGWLPPTTTFAPQDWSRLVLDP